MTHLGPQPDWINARWHCGHNPDPNWNPANECGKPCTLHIKLDDGLSYIGACAEHERDALLMPHEDQHRWGQWCMAPGSLWICTTVDDRSRCELDDSGEEPALTGAVSIGAPA